MAYKDLQKELAEKSKTIKEQENAIAKLVDQVEMEKKLSLESMESEIHKAGEESSGKIWKKRIVLQQ